jgi:hypothetical protein
MCPSELETNREESRGTDATPDAFARLVYHDPAKTLVMTYLRRLISGGVAEWHMLENGDIRLRLLTGQTYLLGKTTVIRIA